ncbi:type II toxin-antitoxin system RelE/ParE family toxin [Shewanella sp. YLB-07]|uniref:type II toxin-antitoxin system RelE/ParE family toxin n=1 Tax=Shewanella sp. YLB-07 TaxID=2601268 RepID=UPI00128B5F77|nr:type II toxin-antitoxin system RelE/ParE family toxin [Shewanella sp. YLB-07]MPY24416.1 type II toxin-antitoxin system RelE/ParE family toxin [Shewanella sp. YLB-07]
MKYTVHKTAEFDKWLSKMKDKSALKAILMRIMRAENGHFGDSKSVGAPILEMRIFVSKSYRVYFTTRDQKIILLLHGGHKGTQQQDINKAHALLAQLED